MVEVELQALPGGQAIDEACMQRNLSTSQTAHGSSSNDRALGSMACTLRQAHSPQLHVGAESTTLSSTASAVQARITAQT